MPVRPFGTFYTGARTGNTAAGHAVNAYAPISPFSIYCQRLVCDGREWCPRSAARKKKTVPANDRYRNTLRLFPYVGIIQIRFRVWTIQSTLSRLQTSSPFSRSAL